MPGMGARDLLLVLAGLLPPAAAPRADLPVLVAPASAATVPARSGIQRTYVFHRAGVQSVVIQPVLAAPGGAFGLLLAVPEAPAVLQAPADLFPQLAAAAEPPELQFDAGVLRARLRQLGYSGSTGGLSELEPLRLDVERPSAPATAGAYAVEVLGGAGGPTVPEWLARHGLRGPDGLAALCREYSEAGWRVVAVRADLGGAAALPPLQLRFRADELVLPMRLAALDGGAPRDVLYLLTDRPLKVAGLTAELVVRQIPGEELVAQVTEPLPVRVVSGTVQELVRNYGPVLEAERDPAPHSGAARALFAADLLAAREGRLRHPFEEELAELREVSERLGLRGARVDALHAGALRAEIAGATAGVLEELRGMTLTVVDGALPPAALAASDLGVEAFSIEPARNGPAGYDVRLGGPRPEREGERIEGELRTPPPSPGLPGGPPASPPWLAAAAALLLLAVWSRRALRLPRPALGAALVLLVAVPPIQPGQPGQSGQSGQGAGPAGRDPELERWVDELADPALREAALAGLTERGAEAVLALSQGIRREGPLAPRGWAVVCLEAIGGPRAAKSLQRVQAEARLPALIRTWAAAARVRSAADFAAVVPLMPLLGSFPELAGPLQARIEAAPPGAVDASVAEALLAAGTASRVAEEAIRGPLEAVDLAALVEVLVTARDPSVRGMAAAWLVTVAEGREREAAARFVEAWRFDPGAQRLPSGQGPLYLPRLAWTTEEARALADSFLRWYLWCDRRSDFDRRRMFSLALRNDELAAPAGYDPPVTWNDPGAMVWLQVWGQIVPREELVAMLRQQLR